jgi:SET domain-containing protein
MFLTRKHLIDGSSLDNSARYINHSCNPNSEIVLVGRYPNKRAYIKATRNIRSEEEITFDYQLEYFKGEQILRCRCGSRNCSGYIVEEKRRGTLIPYLKTQ